MPIIKIWIALSALIAALSRSSNTAQGNQLAEVIQKLIENGELDLTSLDNEVGAGLDGNPNGYDYLPNNQTDDEEVSEQDPAIN